MVRPEIITYYLDDISDLLGLSLTKATVITSGLLAVLSLFYTFKVAFYLQLTVYVLLNRVTYISTFDAYVINRYADYILMSSLTLVWLILAINSGKTRFGVSAGFGILAAVAIIANITIMIDIVSLATLPIIVFWLLYKKKSTYSSFKSRSRISSEVSVHLTLNYVAIVSILIGAISVAISLARISSGIVFPLQYDHAYIIFLVFSSFSPVYIILLCFCFPVKLLINELSVRLQKIRKIRTSYSGKFSPQKNEARLTKEARGEIKAGTRILYLSAFIILSITVAIIPHLITINPDGKQIGTDTEEYVIWVNILLRESTDAYDFVEKMFVTLAAGDRPLTLLILAVLTEIINTSPFYIAEYFPVLLGPSLVLAIYLLTRELTSNEVVSLLAAFLTASASFHILIGIYGGFYANWLALIIGYLSVVFLFKALRAGKKKNLLAFPLLLVLCQFAHVYTWSIISIVMGTFLGTCLVFHYYPKRRVIILMLLLLSSVVVDLAKTIIIGSPGGIARDLQVAKESVGAELFGSRWYNLIDTIQYHYGSIFANFIILLLGLYWLLRSNLRHVPSNMFIAIFLSMGIFPIFLGDWIVQSRVLYDIPFQIPAAIAITLLLKQQTNRIAILLPIFVWLIAISIRTASNLYRVPPT